MSSETAISISNLSKCYQIYGKPRDRLLQMFFRGRRQYYREFWALRDVAFDLQRGETIGIVGRNGAGKSTLLQMICGTLNPTSGTISVRGRVAALLELGAGFNPEFTGSENVYLNASVLGLSKAEIDARYDSIVAFSGIGDFIHQPVKTYSSGMYVRLAFAIATCVEPDILVIDEALSVGDGEFARKSFDRIIELKKKGTTILFCSHSLYQVEAFCDRVLWLDRGHQVMLGAPGDVVPRYSSSLLNDDNASPLPVAGGEPAAVRSVPAGQARLTDITVLMNGSHRQPLKGLAGASTITVRVSFDSDPGLPAPSVGVTVDYGSLLVITCAVSRSDGFEIARTPEGRGVAEVSFPDAAFRKGRYRVSVYLVCEQALHFYDQVVGVTEFEIEDSYAEPGLVSMPHQWANVTGSAESKERS